MAGPETRSQILSRRRVLKIGAAIPFATLAALEGCGEDQQKVYHGEIIGINGHKLLSPERLNTIFDQMSKSASPFIQQLARDARDFHTSTTRPPYYPEFVSGFPAPVTVNSGTDNFTASSPANDIKSPEFSVSYSDGTSEKAKVLDKQLKFATELNAEIAESKDPGLQTLTTIGFIKTFLEHMMYIKLAEQNSAYLKQKRGATFKENGHVVTDTKREQSLGAALFIKQESTQTPPENWNLVELLPSFLYVSQIPILAQAKDPLLPPPQNPFIAASFSLLQNNADAASRVKAIADHWTTNGLAGLNTLTSDVRQKSVLDVVNTEAKYFYGN